MNAVEFLKKQKRLCKSFEDCSCHDCPLFEMCFTTSDELDFDEEAVVRIVEDWVEEHPLRTNGDVVKQMLEENAIWLEYTTRFSDGEVTLTFSRAAWNDEYKGRYGADGCEGCKWDYLKSYEDPCCNCRKNYKNKWESKI